MAGSIEHVVIIVKENHTFDNYFGRFPGADGAQLTHAANPPADDPDHKHQAWMTRAADKAIGYSTGRLIFPATLTWRGALPSATGTSPRWPGPPLRIT